jgi:hypothetical protein
MTSDSPSGQPPPATPSGALALVRLIEQSARQILEAYSAAGLPEPNLNDASTEPLVSPELRNATRVLEGACGQLCATLAIPTHTMLNRALHASSFFSVRRTLL